MEIARKLSKVKKDCQPLELQQEAKRLAMPKRRRSRPCSGERYRHQRCRACPRCVSTRQHTARIGVGAMNALKHLAESGRINTEMVRAVGPFP